MISLLESQNIQNPHDAVNYLFELVDSSRDGKISKPEFIKFFSSFEEEAA
jgi:hypothetical protein